VTRDQRAFFAIDQGSATTSVAIVGWVAHRWRLLGSVALPAATDLEAMLALLVQRLRTTAPGVAGDLGADEGAVDRWARLVVRTSAPRRIVALAATERSLAPLADAAAGAGWRVDAASAERQDPLEISRRLLDPAVSAVLAGASEPAGADERGTLGDLGAIVSAVATRRPELTVVLAGAMADQLPRFEPDAGDRGGEVLLGPSATAGEPAGEALRELLEGIRAPDDDGRRAFARSTATLAAALDRRIEALDLGLGSGSRVVAIPGMGDEQSVARARTLAEACLIPPVPDDPVIDRVLAWSTVPLDRLRLRDRLHELWMNPWAEAPGEGAVLRLTVARAALARLLELTPGLDPSAEPDLVVVAGGAWAVAPGPAVALAVSDVLRRPGSRQLAFDHARLLGPLGAIEDEAERRQVVVDLASDMLVPLGSVVMPQGLRPGRTAGQLVVHGANGMVELDLVPGSLELIDLPPGETAVAELRFRETVRLGARGRRFAVELAGGLGGLLVDLRDIPLRLPDRAERRRELLGAWQDALWTGMAS
jgi:hypothetical protein